MTVNIRGEKTLNFFDSAITAIFSPFQAGITESIKAVNNLWDNYFYLVNLKKENKKLNEDIKLLTEENSRFIEQNLMYQRLSALLESKKKLPYESFPAEIIAIDSLSWSSLVTINKGIEDYVKKKMAVVTPNGLVGYISKAYKKRSKVMLITDSRSSVDVRIQKNRYRGTVVGLNKVYCKINYVPLTVDIKVGDRVVSSGLGGLFPKGILVGFIRKVEKMKFGLFQEIELTPAADLSRLEEVLLVEK